MARKPSRSAIAKKAWQTRKANILMKDIPKYEPKNHAMSLCGQAEDAISTLEARLSKIIRRINSINNL